MGKSEIKKKKQTFAILLKKWFQEFGNFEISLIFDSISKWLCWGYCWATITHDFRSWYCIDKNNTLHPQTNEIDVWPLIKYLQKYRVNINIVGDLWLSYISQKKFIALVIENHFWRLLFQKKMRVSKKMWRLTGFENWFLAGFFVIIPKIKKNPLFFSSKSPSVQTKCEKSPLYSKKSMKKVPSVPIKCEKSPSIRSLFKNVRTKFPVSVKQNVKKVHLFNSSTYIQKLPHKTK